MKKYYKLNNQINYPQVRVIDSDGKQLGILKIEEAKEKAKQQDLDLVEIAAQAQPPVVKIVDFAKFKYLEEKKEKEARKHTKETEQKEVRFTPFIGEHDLQTGLEKAKKFLNGGDLVKIAIRFKGAQMAHQEFGPRLLFRILAQLEGIGKEDRVAKMEGRQYVTVLKPISKGEKQKAQTVPQQTISGAEQKKTEISKETRDETKN